FKIVSLAVVEGFCCKHSGRSFPFASTDECAVIRVPDQHLLDTCLPEPRKARLLVVIGLLGNGTRKQCLHLRRERDDSHIEVEDHAVPIVAPPKRHDTVEHCVEMQEVAAREPTSRTDAAEAGLWR